MSYIGCNILKLKYPFFNVSSKMLVEVDKLVKRYGRTLAVKEVTFSIGNEVIGLIGPNGAGKTTILKILLGLIKADEGRATIFGRDCWEDSLYIRQRVGVLHEKIYFFDQLTVERYLKFIASLYDMEINELEVFRILCELGISNVRDRKIGTLSAGELQRLGLAQAIIGRPQLVLLDEPTSNLDPIGRRDFLNKIETLHNDDNTAFLICSHVLHELEQICDRFIIMHQGRVLAQGVPSEISEEYGLAGYEVVCKELEGVKRKISRISQIKDVIVLSRNSLVITFDRKAKLEVKNSIEEIKDEIIEIREVSPPVEAVFKEVISRG